MLTAFPKNALDKGSGQQVALGNGWDESQFLSQKDKDPPQQH